MTQANTLGLFPDGRRLWLNLPVYTEARLASPLTASRRMSNYELDDAYPHSPGLKAVRVKATPFPSLPPFIPQQITMPGPENVSPHSLKKRKKPNRRNTRPSRGDTVLINFMDPNRPDIARLVGERALSSDSGSEADDEEREEREERESEPATSDSTLQAGPNLASLDLVGTAQAALQEGVKKWAQLKEWASRNPALAPNIDTSELLLPQAMHAQDLLLQQQHMNGQRIPPQSNNAGAVPNAQPGGQAPQARMVSQTIPLTQMQARSRPQMLQGMQHGSLRKRNAQFYISPETSPIDVLVQTSTNDNEIRQRQQRKHLRNEQVTYVNLFGL